MKSISKKIMKIYTKTGDKGDTSLFGGKRTAKSSLRIDAYGTVDELNAQLGVVLAHKPPVVCAEILSRLQNELFVLGADLADPIKRKTAKIGRINKEHILNLEKILDQLEEKTVPIRSFILPGGEIAGAQLHVARTVCRRAERLVDALSRKEDIGRYPLIYLNRFSDLLFVLARYINQLTGVSETTWPGSLKMDTEKK